MHLKLIFNIWLRGLSNKIGYYKSQVFNVVCNINKLYNILNITEYYIDASIIIRSEFIKRGSTKEEDGQP